MSFPRRLQDMSPGEQEAVHAYCDATILIYQHATGYRPATEAELEAAAQLLGLTRALEIARRADSI
jgi:hypothetical protein